MAWCWDLMRFLSIGKNKGLAINLLYFCRTWDLISIKQFPSSIYYKIIAARRNLSLQRI